MLNPSHTRHPNGKSGIEAQLDNKDLNLKAINYENKSNSIDATKKLKEEVVKEKEVDVFFLKKKLNTPDKNEKKLNSSNYSPDKDEKKEQQKPMQKFEFDYASVLEAKWENFAK